MQITKSKIAFTDLKNRKRSEIKRLRKFLEENFYTIVNESIKEKVESYRIKGVDIPEQFPTIYLDTEVDIKYNDDIKIMDDEELVKHIIHNDFKKSGWDVKVTRFLSLFSRVDIKVVINKIPDVIKPKLTICERFRKFLEV